MSPAPVHGPTAHRLRARLAREQVAGRAPSVVAGLIRDGGLAWADGYGAVPGDDPTDVQYRIGSITKTMTAVLVHRLVREGRLGLDDTVGSVLDELADGATGRATVRTLLSHSAGLRAEPVGDWWERSAGISFERLAAAHAGVPSVLPPGQQLHYSNLGYGLLGEVAARLHDAPWWDCVRDQVLGPLGMGRTSYLPEGPAAQGYSVHPWAGTLTEEPATDTGAMAPAGQLWSTVADLATYAAFLVAGHPDVLSLDDLRRAAHVQSGDQADGLGGGFGLGFQLTTGGPGGSGTLVGHGGSMPGFLATCLVDRRRGTGCVAFANATTGPSLPALGRDLLEELESSEPAVPAPWTPATRVPPPLEPLLGVWYWGNTAMTFSLEGEEVVARRGELESWRFGVRDGRVVGTGGYHTGEPVDVVRRDDGSVSHLDVATFVLTRVPYDPDAPIPGGHP
ncbi:serine hydrolase domain-containing protein [Nocardioides donggukensis]|uniref:Beta-lactamase family protein n=1 Tax=Nocardioides donggukensis TaxID=2774019 RepID=A0A927K3X2_9ACTN|nr:serine hydrolase domain-containing protein [Nocardioides donggukensis]MBD8869346.1 beta-lactamase family protein [Nocardioides donggukensis]